MGDLLRAVRDAAGALLELALLAARLARCALLGHLAGPDPWCERCGAPTRSQDPWDLDDWT